MHHHASRGLGLRTQNLPQNEPWTILKPACNVARNSNIPAWLDLLCYLINLIVCLMFCAWLVHYAAYCTWQQRSNGIKIRNINWAVHTKICINENYPLYGIL